MADQLVGLGQGYAVRMGSCRTKLLGIGLTVLTRITTAILILNYRLVAFVYSKAYRRIWVMPRPCQMNRVDHPKTFIERNPRGQKGTVPSPKRGVKATELLIYPPIFCKHEHSFFDCLTLLLVSPTSSAEVERSFSALRRLKTWLRSTMIQLRLNSLGVCHVCQELLDLVDVNALIEQFVSRNDTRVFMFGK